VQRKRKKKKAALKKRKKKVRNVLKKPHQERKKKPFILGVCFQSAELCIDSYLVLSVVVCLLELELSLD
jgi:hypothetical protein